MYNQVVKRQNEIKSIYINTTSVEKKAKCVILLKFLEQRKVGLTAKKSWFSLW